jgi:hypothetical protein
MYKILIEWELLKLMESTYFHKYSWFRELADIDKVLYSCRSLSSS